MECIEVLFQSDDDMNVEFEGTDDTDVGMDELEVVVSTDHRELRHLDAPNQHPIESVVGLAEAIGSFNEQLEQHLANNEAHITEEERTNWNHKSRVYRNASGALVISV